MKLFLILLVGLTLIGCGKPGNTVAPNSVIPTIVPVVPGCKSIYSLWQSETDLESHDFRVFDENTITAPDHEWRASDGLICGYVNNPYHFVRIQLWSRNLTIEQDPRVYDYVLGFSYSLPIGSTCDRFGVATSQNQTVRGGFIRVGCNSIKICSSDFNGNIVDCKVFR